MGWAAARMKTSDAVVIAVAALLGCGCAAGETSETEGPQLAGDSTGGSGGWTPATTTDPPGGDADDGTDEAGATAGPGTDDGVPATDGGSETTEGSCDPIPWARDDDGDGYGDPATIAEACVAPPGYVADATDCDDGDPTVHPGALETCGGPDKDCDFLAPALCNSCAQLLASGNADTTGLYTIDVDGARGEIPPSQVWCDQETDGGGWTLVQRTVWDPGQTDALRTGFSAWRGQTIGNPSPGQGYRLQGNAWNLLNLQLDHMVVHELRQADGETCDPLYYIGVGGELTVSDVTALLTGVETDAPLFADAELSTTDSGPSTTCIIGNNAVPWFYGSCCSTCPVYEGSYWNEPHPMVSYTHTIADFNGNLEGDVCTGPVMPSINGSSYRGVDAMAYYLR